jgi:hypothetical protein
MIGPHFSPDPTSPGGFYNGGYLIFSNAGDAFSLNRRSFTISLWIEPSQIGVLSYMFSIGQSINYPLTNQYMCVSVDVNNCIIWSFGGSATSSSLRACAPNFVVRPFSDTVRGRGQWERGAGDRTGYHRSAC